MKKVLVSGATGQDGALLSDFLLKKGYEVYGMARRTSSPTDWRIIELRLYENPNFHVVSGDLTDVISLQNVLDQTRPDEVYNLGAQSYVGASWKNPLTTWDITAMGAVRLFEAVRIQEQKQGSQIKIYQASSSEMFGGERKTNLMDENEHFSPRSPYGAAKAAAHYAAKVNRESYGSFIACGILFNHESEFRGIEFVTRKVTDGVARIILGLQKKITLGCLDSIRDFGYAGDYVEAMWLMLQQEKPDDFVIATSFSHSIADLCRVAFGAVGIKDWEKYIAISTSGRPADVKSLRGNYDKAYRTFGWEPKMSFEIMIEKMVGADLQRLTGVENVFRNKNGLYF